MPSTHFFLPDIFLFHFPSLGAPISPLHVNDHLAALLSPVNWTPFRFSSPRLCALDSFRALDPNLVVVATPLPPLNRCHGVGTFSLASSVMLTSRRLMAWIFPLCQCFAFFSAVSPSPLPLPKRPKVSFEPLFEDNSLFFGHFFTTIPFSFPSFLSLVSLMSTGCIPQPRETLPSQLLSFLPFLPLPPLCFFLEQQQTSSLAVFFS